jgi:hypothetical protein
MLPDKEIKPNTVCGHFTRVTVRVEHARAIATTMGIVLVI